MKTEIGRLRAELEKEYAFGNLIGRSQPMLQMFSLMRQAIESDITVLIQGESGTGKELVAKAIHFNGSREKGPFVAVNCAAIPETLIESELFGHERGAFTGATTRRPGKFEQADGGTIFLDEIGEMPPLLQAKLLRVLQEREIQRVGGTTTIPVDVRVVTATNIDLEAALNTGKFRPDLFYRIAVFPIVIPPLRERGQDITLLAEHFLGKYSQATDEPITAISPEALKILLHHDWPGNVRELENIIQRAVLLETSGVLQAHNIALRQISSIVEQFSSGSVETRPLPLEVVEKQAIVHALKVTNDNITHAARVLNIDRTTLHRKLKKYQLLEKK
jgi:transcriptional regulator with PAS, ATPase and Fis domain